MCDIPGVSSGHNWSVVCTAWQLDLPATDNSTGTCCSCLCDTQRPRKKRILRLKCECKSSLQCLSGYNLSEDTSMLKSSKDLTIRYLWVKDTIHISLEVCHVHGITVQNFSAPSYETLLGLLSTLLISDYWSPNK